MPTTPGASARVQLLGDVPTVPVDTRLIGREGETLMLHSPCALGHGQPVRIDVNGGMVLGEVAGCEPVGTGSVVSVRIDHVIPSMSDLARLVERVMCESGAPRGVADGPGRRGNLRQTPGSLYDSYGERGIR